MKRLLILLLTVVLAASLATAKPLRQMQVQFVDEFGDPVNMGTSVSITVYLNDGVTEGSLYLDRGGTTAVTQPITDDSTNTPLVYQNGLMTWWQAEPDYDITATDGTTTRTLQSMTGSSVRIAWPSYIRTASAYSLGQNDDLDYTFANWIVRGSVANRLDLLPDNDGALIYIGDTSEQADFWWLGGTDGTDYVEFNEGASEARFVDTDVILSGGSLLQVADSVDLNGAMDADVTSWAVDASTGFSLDSAGDASNVTIAADGAADDLTIAVTGATDSSIVISSAGTGADALQLTASAGGIDIAAAGAAAGEDIDITTSASVNITPSEAVADQFKVDATGTVAGNAINLETTDGGVLVNADGAANGDIELNAADDLSLTAAGLVNVSGSFVFAGIQDIPAGGTSTAVTLTNQVITVGADAGGDIVTIANGTAGQVLILVCEDATGTTTITPATFNGGTSITFDALGDTVTLVYTTGTGWSIVGGNSYTII